MIDPHIIIIGDPVHGFQYLGPFQTRQHAQDARRQMRQAKLLDSERAWIAPITLPPATHLSFT